MHPLSPFVLLTHLHIHTESKALEKNTLRWKDQAGHPKLLQESAKLPMQVNEVQLGQLRGRPCAAPPAALHMDRSGLRQGAAIV